MQFSLEQKSYLTWSIVGLLVAWALWYLGPVLAPFVIAAVLAYALTPLVNRLNAIQRPRLPRVLVVLLVESAFLCAMFAVVLLIIPILAKEIPLMREQLPTVLDRLNAALGPMLEPYGLHVSFDGASARAFAVKYLNANVSDAIDSALHSLRLGGSVAFAVVGNVVLIPVVLFYLLMEWSGFVDQMRKLIPPKMRPGVEGFIQEADAVLGQYLRGQLLVTALLALYYSLGLWVFGLDLAVPIGVFTGLAVFVPYLGFGLGMVLASLSGMLQFSSGAGVEHAALMVAIVFGCGQLLEGFFLTPRLVGGRIGLHPVGVIFALLAFGQIFGFVGVLVALPVSAVLLVAVRRLKRQYESSSLYQGGA